MVARNNKSKKTVQEVAEVKPVGLVEGPVTKEGALCFSTQDLLRFELMQTKVQQAQQQMKIHQADLEIMRNNFESLARKNQQQQAATLAELRVAEKNLMVLREEIERVYKIELAKITYDDVSGQIYFPPEPVEDEKPS